MRFCRQYTMLAIVNKMSSSKTQTIAARFIRPTFAGTTATSALRDRTFHGTQDVLNSARWGG